jgi:hypothetical protein
MNLGLLACNYQIPIMERRQEICVCGTIEVVPCCKARWRKGSFGGQAFAGRRGRPHVVCPWIAEQRPKKKAGGSREIGRHPLVKT